jgi:tetratricopeptide (TPR) repeat protein
VGFEVRLFGVVRAFWGEQALDLGGSRTRAVLAVLALHPGQVVSRERLVEYAWQSGPADADELLAASVYRLREALAPAQEQVLLRSVRGGFVAELDAGAVDAHRFRSLLESAGAASGPDVEVSVRLGRALDVWRGQANALVDVHSDWLREQAGLLEGRRLDVLEQLARLQVDAGRPQQAVDLLRNIPPPSQRQGLAAVSIRALIGAEQGAEAAEVARAVAGALAQQGRQPDSELRAALETALGTHLTGPSRGPRQLPTDTAVFTGRAQELERLLALAEQAEFEGSPGAVVISAIGGMGGIGKTALAIRAAHRLADRYPDGQLFVDLHGFTQGSAPREPGDALAVLLGGLGVRPGQIPADLDARAALYRDRLADTRTLIVLDNAADEAQVRPLLPACDTCLVLVTSRRRLGALDDALPVALDVLAIGEAEELLSKAARLDIDAAGEPLLEQAAELCGRLPLALLIAGALLRTGGKAWNLTLLIDRLADRRPGHELAGYTDEARSLTAVFDLSYRHLPMDQQLLFRRLGLLPGPEIDAYAAAALLQINPDEAGWLVQRLADHSLLIGANPGRYRLHDLIRAHARTLTSDVDLESEGDAARDRLLHYYAHTAQSASLPIAHLPRSAPGGPAPAHSPDVHDPQTAQAWLRIEYPNLDAAFTYAGSHALDEHAIALAAGLAEILSTDGPFTRALEVHQAAADAAVRLHQPGAHATALNDLGRMRFLTGEYPGAKQAHLRALEFYQQIGDLLGQANALTDLGQAWHLAEADPRAEDTVLKALEIFRRIRNRLGEAEALSDLGRVRYVSGDYPEAAEALTQALEISRQIGHRRGEANALRNLGRVRHATGDCEGATQALTQALEISRQIGHRRGEAGALIYLGRVRHATGDREGATQALTQALEISRQIGTVVGEARALTFLGRVQCATGDYEGAESAQAQALDIFRRMGDRIDQPKALNYYAMTIAAIGERPRALALYRQALDMARELNYPVDEAIALEGIADHDLVTGNPTHGAEHLHQALQIYQHRGMRPDIDRVTTRLARFAPQ